MDCYLTMAARWEVEDGRISKVSFVPAYLPEDCNPYFCPPEDPRFDEIVAYMRKITEAEGLSTQYTLSEDGREILIS